MCLDLDPAELMEELRDLNPSLILVEAERFEAKEVISALKQQADNATLIKFISNN